MGCKQIFKPFYNFYCKILWKSIFLGSFLFTWNLMKQAAATTTTASTTWNENIVVKGFPFWFKITIKFSHNRTHTNICKYIYSFLYEQNVSVWVTILYIKYFVIIVFMMFIWLFFFFEFWRKLFTKYIFMGLNILY